MPCPGSGNHRGPKPAAKSTPKTVDVEVTLVFHTAKDAFIQPHVTTVKAAVESAIGPVTAELKTRNVTANVTVKTTTTPPSDKDILATGSLPSTKRAYWVYVLSDEQLAAHLLLKHVEAKHDSTREMVLRQMLKTVFSTTGLGEGIALAGAGVVPAKLSFELSKDEVVHFQNVVIHELGHAVSQNKDPKADHGTEVMQATLSVDEGPLGYPASFVKRLADKLECVP